VRTLVLEALFVGLLTGLAQAQATTNVLGIPVTYPSPPPGMSTPRPLPDALSAQTHPAPTATPLPGRIAVSGRVRAYDFDRFNHVQNPSNPDRYAIAFGVGAHLDYHIGDTPLNFGYTYYGSTPFGFDGPNPIANSRIDNSLPGYNLNQPAHELYLQYKDANAAVTIGNQELNYAFLPNSDSRIAPESYQGIDSTFKLAPSLAFTFSRIIGFENRTSSNFEQDTQLTASYPQTTIAQYHPFSPGAQLVGLNFHPSPRFNLSAQDYQFYDIANLAYGEAKYGIDPYSKLNPYVAVQYAAEAAIGSKQVGNVQNNTFGAQLGANVVQGLSFTASTDIAPWQYAYVSAKSETAAEAGYLVPNGGSGAAQKVGTNLYKIAYGGLASPYTDALNSDPFYTTSISQGMVGRRSAGNTYKTALVYTPPSQQWKLLASEAWYQYSNDIANNLTSEFNVDGTYYLNKVRPSKPYKGLLLRIRIAPRNQPTLPYNFEYQRYQAEYDF
jgi:hypothetical protein